jgi:hypothetical protein
MKEDGNWDTAIWWSDDARIGEISFDSYFTGRGRELLGEILK